MPMTEIEKGCFPRLFNRGGYVLNFTTDSFDTFTKSSVGVAPCARYGLSKGRSLTAYIEEAPPEDASKLLCDLFEHYEAHHTAEIEGGSSERGADEYRRY